METWVFFAASAVLFLSIMGMLKVTSSLERRLSRKGDHHGRGTAD